MTAAETTRYQLRPTDESDTPHTPPGPFSSACRGRPWTHFMRGQTCARRRLMIEARDAGCPGASHQPCVADPGSRLSIGKGR